MLQCNNIKKNNNPYLHSYDKIFFISSATGLVLQYITSVICLCTSVLCAVQNHVGVLYKKKLATPHRYGKFIVNSLLECL